MNNNERFCRIPYIWGVNRHALERSEVNLKTELIIESILENYKKCRIGRLEYYKHEFGNTKELIHITKK